MTDPEIITALRGVIAPGSTHLDVRLSRENIVELLAGWDAPQRARADAARYSWLVAGEYIGQRWKAVEYRWNGCDGKNGFDSAVDAAMKERA